MPSKKNYSSPQMYQRELSKERAKRRKDKEHVVANVTVYAHGAVPPIDYDGDCREFMSSLVQKETTKIGQQLRRHIRSKWLKEQKGDCIVVVNSTWYMQKGYVTYTVELTALGALTHKKWLAEAINEFGLDCKVVNRGQSEDEIDAEHSKFNWSKIRHRQKPPEPVTKCTMDGKPIFTYFTATEAANDVGSTCSNIRFCCLNHEKSAKGYKWRYAKEIIDEKEYV